MTIANETIVDRVVERLRKQPLGDLITEADLHEIVKTAIPKVFFEKRIVKDWNGYSSRDVEKEPAIIEVMRELLRESAKAAVAKWMTDNPETIAAQWKAVFDESIVGYVEKIQRERVTADVRSAMQPWLDAVNRERQAAGLMPLYL